MITCEMQLSKKENKYPGFWLGCYYGLIYDLQYYHPDNKAILEKIFVPLRNMIDDELIEKNIYFVYEYADKIIGVSLETHYPLFNSVILLTKEEYEHFVEINVRNLMNPKLLMK